MQSVDGDVRLSVTLNTKTVQESLSILKNTIANSMKESVKSTAALSGSFKKVIDSAKKAFQSPDVSTEEYDQLESKLQSLKERFTEIADKQEALANEGKADTEEFAKLEAEAEAVGGEIDKVNSALQQAGQAAQNVQIPAAENAKELYQNVNKVKSDLNGAEQSAQTFSNTAGMAADGVSAKFMQLQNNVQKAAEKVELAKLKLEEFQNQSAKPTAEYNALTKELNKISNEILKINAQKKAFKEDYGLGAEELSGYKKLNAEMGLLVAQYEKAKVKREEMEQAGTAFKSDEVKFQSLSNALRSAEREYEVATQKANEYAEAQQNAADESKNVSNAHTSLKNAVSSSKKDLSFFSGVLSKINKMGKSAFATIGNIGRKALNSITANSKKAGQALSNVVAKPTESFKKGLKTILKYGLSLRGLYAIFRKLSASIKEGYKNLATYSDRVNNSVSSMLSMFTQFKNQAAAAFQPLETAIAPYINSFIDILNRALFSAAQFFAAITGQDYVYKAVKVQTSYVDKLEDTAEAAEDAKKSLQQYLSPLDEISKFTSAQEDTSILGSDTAPEDMFETVEVESRFKDLAKKVKDIFGGIKDYLGDIFEPFRISWKNNGSVVIKAWSEALDRIKSTLKDISEDFKTVWTNGSGEKLLDNILTSVKLLGDGVKAFVGAFQDAWNENDLGQHVIQSMIDHANALLELINAIGEDLIEVWNAGHGKKIWGDILTIVKNINRILGKFYGRIKKAWDKNDTGRKIWEKILEIVEEITGFFTELSEITFDWIDDIDFSPVLEGVLDLLDSFKSLIKVLNGKFKTVYEKILLPLAKWTIEKGVPALLNALGDALEFIANVVDKIPEDVLIGIASAIAGLGTAILIFKSGQAIASGISAVTGALKNLGALVAAHPIMAIATAITAVVTAVIAYNKLKWSNTGISNLIGEFEEYYDSMLEISNNISDFVSSSEKTLSESFADTSLIENYRGRLQELLADARIDPDEEAEFQIITDYFSKKFPEFDTIINEYIKKSDDGKIEIVDDLSEMGEKLDLLIDKYKKMSIASTYSSLAEEGYKNQIQNRREYNELVTENKKLFDAYDKYESIVRELRFYRTQFIEAWNNNDKERFEALQKVLDERGQDLVDQANATAKTFEQYGLSVESIEKVNNDLIEANQWRWQGNYADTGLENMYHLLDDLIPVVQSAREAQDAANNSLQEGEDLVARYTQAQIYLADGIKDNYLGALELYEQGLITADEVMENFGITIEELEKKAGEQGLTGTLAKSAASINSDMDSMGSTAETNADKVTGAFEDIEKDSETSINDTKNNISELDTTVETSMSNMINAIKTAAEASIKKFEELRKEAEKTGETIMGLGAMTGINMGVSYITTKNGTTRSIGSYISEVPALARGAVIPANREFLALLGDQSHGNNIEAPESLIRRIVREETAGLGGGKSNQYQFTAQLNGRTIFDAVIKEAKLRQTLNNKNPFELA